jgi:hypothetical protein
MLASMRILSCLGKLFVIVLAVGAAAAQGKVMEARIAAVKTGAASLRDVRLRLQWADGAEVGSLRLQADSLEVPTLAYRARGVDWQCPVRRDAGQRWRCEGRVRVAGSAEFPLVLDLSPAATSAQLQLRGTRVAYESRAAAPDLSRLRIEQVPVAWLQGFLAGLWEEGRWTQGRLSGRVDIASPAKTVLEVRGDLQARGLALETPDGLLAAAGVDARLRLGYREFRQSQRIDAAIELHGGELLAKSFYAVLPRMPVQVQLVAERTGASANWRLPSLGWRDAGVLQAEGSAALGAAGELEDLDLRLDLRDLSVARDRYLSGFLAPAGFADLVLAGGLQAELRMQGGALRSAGARLQAVNAVDRNSRFIFAGVDGDLRWTRDGTAVASRLGWDNAALYGIGLGRADASFSSADGEFRLSAPTALEVLGGRLRLDHLHWQAPATGVGTRVDLGLTLEDLDLASLSQRLGWPAFAGTLGGRIPSAHYQDNVLRFDGGLRMDVFGGSVGMQHLVMERPFGVAPTLSADVAIQDVDLEPMTRAFGFGWITGRMDGRIDQLRLVDWSPAAFEARLETDSAWKGKRRISQRAVNDISSVGGSGLVAGLQARVLALFDDFGYDRIGIGCKLKDNVCRMAGIGSAGDGYIIVAGAGLPRIQVVGFRRRVDWPTLVARLTAATEGQTPVIE